MFLKHQSSGDLVEVLSMDTLIDPCLHTVLGQFHAGEEMQDSRSFEKADLVFPSGESLPACWVNPDYRLH